MAALIPPCAAIEWALLDESWKQKALTLYPCSERVAQADPPANPVPTTITSIFLLLAGLTNRTLFLWVLHLRSSGPFGTLEFKEDIFWIGFNSFIKECKSIDLFLIILFFSR